MTFFSNLANTADNLLTQYGKTYTIKRRTSGSYNVATGAVTNTTTDYTAKGQAFEYKDYIVANSNGLIKQGDRQVLLSGKNLSFAPNPTTDTIVISGDEWRIVNVKKPVDEQVIYELQVRRGG